MLDTAIGLGLPQPLLLSASPLGLSKLWGGGPQTVTKDIFNVPILSTLGFHVSCWVIPPTKHVLGWVCFVYGEYTSCICGDEVLPYRLLFAPDSQNGLVAMVTMSLNYLT